MGPRQNRVTPTGEIVAIPLRGSWMGNRGILHDDAGHVVRNHASSLWITCALSFKGWRAPVAAAPLHGPLLPRRGRVAGGGPPSVRAVPARGLRRIPGRSRRARPRETVVGQGDRRAAARRATRPAHAHPAAARDAAWSDVPAGAFVILDDGPHLVSAEGLVRWTTTGYADARHGRDRDGRGPHAARQRRGAPHRIRRRRSPTFASTFERNLAVLQPLVGPDRPPVAAAGTIPPHRSAEGLIRFTARRYH